MPKMNMLKSIGIPVGAGLAGIGGGAVLGSELQKRKLVKAFNTYNQQENSAIAQNFFEQGAMAGMGKKAAYLEQVTISAFNDELEKMGGLGNVLAQGGKAMWESTKALGRGIRGAAGMVRHSGARTGAEYGAARQTVKSNLRQSLPAVAAIGAGGAGVAGGYVAGGMGRRDRY